MSAETRERERGGRGGRCVTGFLKGADAAPQSGGRGGGVGAEVPPPSPRLVEDGGGPVGTSGLDDLLLRPHRLVLLRLTLAHVDDHAGGGLCPRVELILFTWRGNKKTINQSIKFIYMAHFSNKAT